MKRADAVSRETVPPCHPEAVERWRAIPGHENYEASDHGRIRNGRNGRVLSPQRHTRGYVKVHLGARVGVNCQSTVHRAVALAWLPAPEGALTLAGWDVDHEDFDRQNNHLTNLRWMRAPLNRQRFLRHNLDAEREAPEWTAEDEAALGDALAAGGWV